MTPTRLLLVRHGQSTWNAQGRWQGRADPPLSSLGQHQAASAATKIGLIDAVFASPLVRAQQTAAIIARHLGIGPVVVDERFIESDAGDWTGLTHQEIRNRWPGWVERNRLPDNFEKAHEVQARMTEALRDVAAAMPGACVLVVTHGGSMRNLDLAIGDQPHGNPNLGARWYDVQGEAIAGGNRLVLVDAEHVTMTRTSGEV